MARSDEGSAEQKHRIAIGQQAMPWCGSGGEGEGAPCAEAAETTLPWSAEETSVRWERVLELRTQILCGRYDTGASTLAAQLWSRPARMAELLADVYRPVD